MLNILTKLKTHEETPFFFWISHYVFCYRSTTFFHKYKHESIVSKSLFVGGRRNPESSICLLPSKCVFKHMKTFPFCLFSACSTTLICGFFITLSHGILNTWIIEPI